MTMEIPDATKLLIGGYNLDQKVINEISNFVAILDEQFELKYGKTALFWNIVADLQHHVGKGKE